MEYFYKVQNCGYYTDLDQAVKVAKNNKCDILIITVNKIDDYQKNYLKHNVFQDFVYLTYTDNTFYDPLDETRLQEEKDKYKEYEIKKFEERKNIIYKNTPKLGWCDYPEQFAEKCTNFNGVVKFQLIKRLNVRKFELAQYRDYSSKYVDSYYYAEYIGNYNIDYLPTNFSKYDGKTIRNDGTLYPLIDEIWLFETDRYPFGNFLYDLTLKVKVNNGKMIKYESNYDSDLESD